MMNQSTCIFQQLEGSRTMPIEFDTDALVASVKAFLKDNLDVVTEDCARKQVCVYNPHETIAKRHLIKKHPAMELQPLPHVT